MTGSDRRQMARRRPRARRHRLVLLRRRVVALAIAGAVVLAVFAALRSGPQHPPSRRPGGASAARAGSARLVTMLEPWQLPTPLSRAVALPVDGRIGVFGGLGPASATTSAIVGIDPGSGTVDQLGTLASPVHDSAGAVVGSRYLVFGGGAQTVTADVQALPGGQSGSVSTQASVVGTLPSRRADLAAVSTGNTVLLVGGYDGTNPSPDVLQTTDGVTFTVLAQLPVPVRYPAVAVRDNTLWVIGGELRSGQGDSTAIQRIDLGTRAASVAGQLASGLSHASAANLGGTVYVFGGRSGGHALDAISALDAATVALHPVGSLAVATSDMAVTTLGQAVYLVGGEGEHAQPIRSVYVARMVRGAAAATPSGAAAGTVARVPFAGRLLIADRGNNRLVLVGADRQVLWIFPSAAAPAPPQGFYFPDDAFFAKAGTAIITNEEQQHTIIELAFPSGQVIASYGHPGHPGRAPGYLNQPDDAYLLKDGRVTVADAKNCRILFLNPDFTYASAIGSTGRCRHDIPNDVAYPNGDTPLADGNLLISEINGAYVDEVTPTGTVVWSVKLPLAYPSDPQQIGPDLYLIADYARPGGLYEFTREGQIVWSYSFPAGEAMLDHPSLTEQLPNGCLAVNDDYRHRVVIIDPATKQIVWQYGQTDHAGTGPDQLNTPDGFDLLAADNATPTHPQTG